MRVEASRPISAYSPRRRVAAVASESFDDLAQQFHAQATMKNPDTIYYVYAANDNRFFLPQATPPLEALQHPHVEMSSLDLAHLIEEGQHATPAEMIAAMPQTVSPMPQTAAMIDDDETRGEIVDLVEGDDGIYHTA